MAGGGQPSPLQSLGRSPEDGEGPAAATSTVKEAESRGGEPSRRPTGHWRGPGRRRGEQSSRRPARHRTERDQQKAGNVPEGRRESAPLPRPPPNRVRRATSAGRWRSGRGGTPPRDGARNAGARWRRETGRLVGATPAADPSAVSSRWEGLGKGWRGAHRRPTRRKPVRDLQNVWGGGEGKAGGLPLP